jgi:prepilin-type processing-associated H-X9-DG protein/prepilin-type N-terminal cleavage/methylation domain-containing protein
MNPTRPFIFKKAHENGFTFVELLVVIATVAILAVLLLPALAGTKPSPQAFQCLENQRQMVLAWQMYSDDNGGKIAPNMGQGGLNGGATMPTLNAYPCWVAGWLSGLEVTNTAMLINHVQFPYGAFLGPYIKTANAFKCPADQSTSKIYGLTLPRCRSISMNNFLGSPAQPMAGSGAGAYPTYPKISSLKSAALTFVFLDEREDSINDGVFFTSANNPSVINDIPANRHNGAAGFSFADGHSEMHQWTSAILKRPIQGLPINNISVSGDPAGLQDSYWLCQDALGLTSFP